MALSAGNFVLAWPNELQADSDFATVQVSGGSWDLDAPVANILTKRLSNVARTSDVSLASTQLWIDLGITRRIKLIAFPFVRGIRFNGKIGGDVNLLVRARAFTAKDSTSTPEWDSDWLEQHPVIYPLGTLPATHPSFINGKITPEDAAKFQWRQPWWAWVDAEPLARYVLIEMNAANSGLRCLELPTAFLSPGYQSTFNMALGASLQVIDLTETVSSDSGADFHDIRPKRRRMALVVKNLPENEALTQALDMMLQLGTHEPLFFAHTPLDTVHRQRRAFMARLSALNPIDYTNFDAASVAYELLEVVD